MAEKTGVSFCNKNICTFPSTYWVGFVKQWKSSKQVQTSVFPIASSLLIITSAINILGLLMIRRKNLQGLINQPLQHLGGVDMSRDTLQEKGGKDFQISYGILWGTASSQGPHQMCHTFDRNSSGGMLKTPVGCLNSFSFSPKFTCMGKRWWWAAGTSWLETVTIFLIFY